MYKVTISGLPGAGKGTLKDLLAKEFGIPAFSVGDLRREFAKELGMNIQEFNQYSEFNPDGDIRADEYQREWAEEKQSFVLEGRLSYHIIPKVPSIFLIAHPMTRAKRIFEEKRKSEQQARSVHEQATINKERCTNDNARYQERYGITDCYNQDNFDIVIDTTSNSPEQTLALAKSKLKDFTQQMNPPTFYLAHPSKSRKQIREWELGFEERTGIELVNPFHDCNSLETEMGHLDEEKYNRMPNPEELFRGDLEYLAKKSLMGSIVRIDDEYTLGTSAEMIASKLMGKLNFTVVTNPVYFNHPAVKLLSDRVFKNAEELEKFLVKNKRKLFRMLEKSRQKTINDSTFQRVSETIGRNYFWNASSKARDRVNDFLSNLH